MPHYRAFHIDNIGQFRGVSEFDCATDRDAIEQARGFVNGLDVELWNGGRLIKRIGSHRPH